MFQDQNFEAYWQKMQQKKEMARVGNSVGGVMLISTVLTLILNLIAASAFLIVGKAELLRDPGTVMMLQILFSVIIFLLPMLLLPSFCSTRLREIFPAEKVPFKTTLPLLLIGFGVLALSNIGNNIFASFCSAFGASPVGYDLEVPSGVFGALLTFLSGAFFPALVEEFAMRGVLLGVLKKRFGNGAAIIVSAIVFGVMHGNLAQIPFAFLIGLYLGYITVFTNSIFPAILLHFTNNFISFALDYLTKALGPTGTNIVFLLYFTLMLCLGVVGVLLFTKLNDSFRIEAGETKKRTLGLCKAPVFIVYLVLTGIEVLAVQLGLF